MAAFKMLICNFGRIAGRVFKWKEINELSVVGCQLSV